MENKNNYTRTTTTTTTTTTKKKKWLTQGSFGLFCSLFSHVQLLSSAASSSAPS
jgi:hypothetical protein